MISRIPAATASSTTYWMSALSIRGSISFGEAFVAGRNRVPNPAAGIMALITRLLRMKFILQRDSLESQPFDLLRVDPERRLAPSKGQESPLQASSEGFQFLVNLF